MILYALAPVTLPSMSNDTPDTYIRFPLPVTLQVYQYMLVVTQAEVPRQASRGHDVVIMDPSTSISLRPGSSQLVSQLATRTATS